MNPARRPSVWRGRSSIVERSPRHYWITGAAQSDPSWKQSDGSREAGVGLASREQGAGSREQEAGSKQQGAGSQESEVGNREERAGSREKWPGSDNGDRSQKPDSSIESQAISAAGLMCCGVWGLWGCWEQPLVTGADQCWCCCWMV